jgi:hypothetical protein
MKGTHASSTGILENEWLFPSLRKEVMRGVVNLVW